MTTAALTRDDTAAMLRAIVLRAAGMTEDGEPAPAGEGVKAALRRAMAHLGLGWRRVRAIWHGEAQLFEWHEVENLRRRDRELAARRAERLRRLAELEAARARGR